MVQRNAPRNLACRGEGSAWLDASLAIGQQLTRDAQRHGRRLSWIGDDLAGNDPVTAQVVQVDVGPNLYGGSAGIGWFLAHVGAYAGDIALERAGIAALASALADCKAGLDASSLSLFSGASGTALAALQVAVRLDRRNLRRSALSLAKATAGHVAAGSLPDEADLIAGLAGIVVALAATHRLAPDRCFIDACRVACNRLVRMGRESLGGTSWPDVHAAAQVPGLCGLGHGASGIAWALDEAAELTGDHHFAEVAADALRYERSWFAADVSNWPDLRDPPPDADAAGWPGSMIAWCHGAIGIGALRWRMYERSGDLAALAEAGASIHAVRTLTARARRALKEGQPSDVTLCHGLGGAVELLLLAHEITGFEEHHRAARRVGELCLDIFRANHRKWTTGLAGAHHVPGLMVGAAGIGTVMLRLHDSTAIGSALLPGRPAGKQHLTSAGHGLISGPVEAQPSGSA